MMDMIDQDKLMRLSVLYDKTGRDWHLSVSRSLTEPSCPIALIQDENGNILCRADRDTIGDAVNSAVDMALRWIERGMNRDEMWGRSQP